VAQRLWLNHAGHSGQRCRKCSPRACTGACTELSSGEATDSESGRPVMSHARQGGRAPDQASSGRQTGVALPPVRIIPRHAARPVTRRVISSTANAGLAAAPERPTPPSLTVPRRGQSEDRLGLDVREHFAVAVAAELFEGRD
jgi:hypothetical protein